jgi:dipeptidyl aminopeptidase/acylaminoacyl peptidase
MLALTAAAGASVGGGAGPSDAQALVLKPPFQIAFVEFGPRDIMTMNGDGSVRTPIATGPSLDGLPAWSADGTKIAFDTTRDGNFEIYTMNANGSVQVNITNHSGADFHPAWSPDGTKIAFTSDRDGDQEIYTKNANGSGAVTQLTFNTVSDGEPHWSPDGTKIVFTGLRESLEIFTVPATGGAATRLTNNLAIDNAPAWSPDGTKIAFASTQNGNDGEIYTMGADGSNQTPLTANIFLDGSPTWKPDSGQIAFMTTRDGDYEIYVMNADGSDETNITNSPATSDQYPDWRRVSTVPGGDYDSDGCTDAREATALQAAGGRRNPQHFWDFYDVWTHPAGMPSVWVRTKVIDIDDMFMLTPRFGTSGNPTANPLTPPTGNTNYHVSYDRSPAAPGMDPWDLGAPDGAIAIDEMFALGMQFGHNCN